MATEEFAADLRAALGDLRTLARPEILALTTVVMEGGPDLAPVVAAEWQLAHGRATGSRMPLLYAH